MAILGFRLPRIIFALLAGAGLSVSGVILQAVLRNDLAAPGVLGVSAHTNRQAPAGQSGCHHGRFPLVEHS